jgi:hypothetical protein
MNREFTMINTSWSSQLSGGTPESARETRALPN